MPLAYTEALHGPDEPLAETLPSRYLNEPKAPCTRAEGGKATGTMTGPQGEVALQDVTISGDQISFSTAGGNAKILFKGTVSGDQIKMTRQREGGDPREFTLKRTQ